MPARASGPWPRGVPADGGSLSGPSAVGRRLPLADPPYRQQRGPAPAGAGPVHRAGVRRFPGRPQQRSPTRGPHAAATTATRKAPAPPDPSSIARSCPLAQGQVQPTFVPGDGGSQQVFDQRRRQPAPGNKRTRGPAVVRERAGLQTQAGVVRPGLRQRSADPVLPQRGAAQPGRRGHGPQVVRPVLPQRQPDGPVARRRPGRAVAAQPQRHAAQAGRRSAARPTPGRSSTASSTTSAGRGSSRWCCAAPTARSRR